jgi:hypothetical protein
MEHESNYHVDNSYPDQDKPSLHSLILFLYIHFNIIVTSASRFSKSLFSSGFQTKFLKGILFFGLTHTKRITLFFRHNYIKNFSTKTIQVEYQQEASLIIVFSPVVVEQCRIFSLFFHSFVLYARFTTINTFAYRINVFYIYTS